VNDDSRSRAHNGLLALRAGTSENAGAYVAVLAVLADASHAYRLPLRDSEIQSRLAANPHLSLTTSH